MSTLVLQLAIVLAVTTQTGPPQPPPIDDADLDRALEEVEEAIDEEKPEETDPPPSLDDLLGLDGAADNAAEEAARENEQELERRLAEAQLSGMFEAALAKMQRSAELLDEEFDAGLGTQRVQQAILFQLDQLIDLAKQMSSQQQMPSGSSGSGQPEPQQSPGQRPQGQQQAGAQGASQGNQAGQATDPPPGQEGDLNTMLEETESEWGHLPPRYREMLEQGQNGAHSALYRKLTEEYYKRLAEEGSS